MTVTQSQTMSNFYDGPSFARQPGIKTADILYFYTNEQIGADIDKLVQQRIHLHRKLLQCTTKLLLLADKLPEEAAALRAFCEETHQWCDQGFPPLPVPLEG